LQAVAIAIPALLLLGALLAQPANLRKIERNQLLLGKVQRGDLQVTVEGYGVLRSNRQRLITALTAATVEEVLLHPGARVGVDSVILRLANPELERELETAAMALAQQEADLRRLKLNNQRDLLAERASLAQLGAELETVKLRREAEQKLVDQGAVSLLTYKTTVLQQEQTQQRLQLQQRRIEQLADVVKESQVVQQQQVNQARAQLESMQRRVDSLTVRAGMEGVLQRLPVELGQSLAAGWELALVGSRRDLLALVQVSQSRAEQLRIGQAAEISINREHIPGTVARIAPQVQEGSVEVEITLRGKLPASARPERNVGARIFTATLENALFIERPLNVRSHADATLFRLEGNGDLARRQPLRFGEEAGRFIQIVSGASENERFILSDMANYSDIEQLRVIN